MATLNPSIIKEGVTINGTSGTLSGTLCCSATKGEARLSGTGYWGLQNFNDGIAEAVFSNKEITITFKQSGYYTIITTGCCRLKFSDGDSSEIYTGTNDYGDTQSYTRYVAENITLTFDTTINGREYDKQSGVVVVLIGNY